MAFQRPPHKQIGLSKEQVPAFFIGWKRVRQMARTDLLFLCNTILGHKDVSQRVHGPILDALQKFEGWDEPHETIQDLNTAYGARKLLGKPKVEMWALTGGRKKLFLYPRGHLKTTVITEAHTIQWLLNYPDIRILLSSGIEDQAKSFLSAVKGHFVKNESFRFLFPEWCPPEGKVDTFGNSENFTLPCRQVTRKEPSCRIATVGKVLSGGHYDVQKHDDLVDKENCRTPQQIEDVKYHFGMMTPLLETSEGEIPHGWQDVAGTRYDFSDLYGSLIATEEKRREAGMKREFEVIERSAAPNWPDGPFLWPERMGYQALKDIEMSETAGPSVLFPQYLMKPIVFGEGLITDESQIKWVPRRIINDLHPRYALHAALDLAGMDTGALGLDNDYSALAVGGFLADGRLDIIDLWHGRPDVFTIIEWVFEVFEKYPRLIKLKIEKEAHARTLLPFLQKEMSKRNRWLPIDPQPRDNQQSKKQKIKGLQPWFSSAGLRFADDLGSKSHLLAEIKGFPKYKHDDILDCCVDIMLERDGAVSDVMGRNYGEDDSPMPVRDHKKMMTEMAFGAFDRDEQGAISALTGF